MSKLKIAVLSHKDLPQRSGFRVSGWEALGGKKKIEIKSESRIRDDETMSSPPEQTKADREIFLCRDYLHRCAFSAQNQVAELTQMIDRPIVGDEFQRLIFRVVTETRSHRMFIFRAGQTKSHKFYFQYCVMIYEPIAAPDKNLERSFGRTGERFCWNIEKMFYLHFIEKMSNRRLAT